MADAADRTAIPRISANDPDFSFGQVARQFLEPNVPVIIADAIVLNGLRLDWLDGKRLSDHGGVDNDRDIEDMTLPLPQDELVSALATWQFFGTNNATLIPSLAWGGPKTSHVSLPEPCAPESPRR